MKQAKKKSASKIVVYTAISGRYDFVRRPLYVDDKIDYVCFSDKDIDSEVWTIRKFDKIYQDPTLTAKKPKILAHKYFSNYQYSVWIDGNIQIKKNITSLIEEKIVEDKLIVFKHRENRQTIYEEVNNCLIFRKDKPEIIKEQAKSYYKKGYDDSYFEDGLPECTILIRRHNDVEVKSLMENWWKEIMKYSKRDQISFAYLLWKNKISFAKLNYQKDFHKYFIKKPHRKKSIRNFILKIVLETKKLLFEL
jgi:hypothetical protein